MSLWETKNVVSKLSNALSSYKGHESPRLEEILNAHLIYPQGMGKGS